jgi:glycosyltransferase involved in cell wall biosynthesis
MPANILIEQPQRPPLTRTRHRLRLAVYVDAVFRPGADRIYTTTAGFGFMLFVAEVGQRFSEITIVGRAVSAGAGTDFELPPGLRLAPLPYYESLRRVGAVLRSAGGTVRGMWRAISEVDVVWAFGPHPLALVLALLAVTRRKRVVLGVRQDTMGYFRARLPGRTWLPILVPLWLLDRAFRLLARRLPAVVVGSELEREYGGPRATLMPTTISLTRTAEIPTEPEPKDWGGVKRLLVVGRIEPEKNPDLALDMLAELDRRRPGEYELAWVGEGRLASTLRTRSAELGIQRSVELAGFVPYGSRLLAMYRAAHLLVHISLTEGSPQVLVEAMGAGIPVVATDVGSVGDTLAGGAAGVLVPPDDRDALVDGVLELVDDPGMRERCVKRGLSIARRHALDAEARRVGDFIAAAASRDRAIGMG